MFPCARPKNSSGTESSSSARDWSTSRLILEAYVRLHKDVPALANAWIADVDVVRLLNARYDFAGAANLRLQAKNVNKHFSQLGTIMLGANFEVAQQHHPVQQVNLLGHYRVWRNVKRGTAAPEKCAFYYACSEDKMAQAPVLEQETTAKDAFDLDKLVLQSDLLCNEVLKTLERCTNDEVAFHLLAFRLPKQPAAAAAAASSSGQKRAALGTDTTNSAATAASNGAAAAAAPPEKKIRQKPGPKPRPKPPPEPKLCKGWSGDKYASLIRHSLVVYLQAQPEDSTLVIPTRFPLKGPKDFHVRYDRTREETPFCIFANGHDPANCERSPKSYKHCPCCMRASGRLRTYRYLKAKHQGNDEDDDDGGGRPYEGDDPPGRDQQQYEEYGYQYRHV